LLASWGEPGTGPGQFMLPHGIAVHPDGRVFVCDRENDRIQVFSPDGEFLAEWTDVQRPTQLAFDAEGRAFVAELCWRAGLRSFRRGPIERHLPRRIAVCDERGTIIARLGDHGPRDETWGAAEPGRRPGRGPPAGACGLGEPHALPAGPERRVLPGPSVPARPGRRSRGDRRGGGRWCARLEARRPRRGPSRDRLRGVRGMPRRRGRV